MRATRVLTAMPSPSSSGTACVHPNAHPWSSRTHRIRIPVHTSSFIRSWAHDLICSHMCLLVTSSRVKHLHFHHYLHPFHASSVMRWFQSAEVLNVRLLWGVAWCVRSYCLPRCVKGCEQPFYVSYLVLVLLSAISEATTSQVYGLISSLMFNFNKINF